MFIRIEKGSSIPISRQVAEQIRAQCLAGLLPPGSRLPSVRELAHALVVNVNTIFRVYERLAADQLIEMRHGDGTYVRLPPAPDETARQLETQRQQFVTELDALVRRGLLLGLSGTDLHRKVDRSLKAAGRRLGNAAGAPTKKTQSQSPEEKS
jgi:GntR family transcriptional regulator